MAERMTAGAADWPTVSAWQQECCAQPDDSKLATELSCSGME